MKAPLLPPPMAAPQPGVPPGTAEDAPDKRVVKSFPAPTPPMQLDAASYKKDSYHHALTRYCSAPDLTLMLQAHTEGTLINRYYRFQVFRDWCAARPVPVYAPYEIEHIRLYCLHVAAVDVLDVE